MRAVKETAYAKINLYLDVTGKRSDGFHEVETVMHTVSLSDGITVEVSPSREASISLWVGGACRLPTDDKNIAVRAARLYLERAGITDSVKITLEKRIPIAAGLAGGSTDAAATLRALNKLYNRRFSDKMLLSLAAELGSDVPFCLVGGTALCHGRGERVERLSALDGLNIVIAVADGEYVSTPAAYAALDAMYSDFDGSVARDNGAVLDKLLAGIKEGRLNADGTYNVFEDAIFSTCHGAKCLKRRISELGALVSMMSGSGPSVFGVFPDGESAAAAARELSAEGYRAYVATSA